MAPPETDAVDENATGFVADQDLSDLIMKVPYYNRLRLDILTFNTIYFWLHKHHGEMAATNPPTHYQLAVDGKALKNLLNETRIALWGQKNPIKKDVAFHAATKDPVHINANWLMPITLVWLHGQSVREHPELEPRWSELDWLMPSEVDDTKARYSAAWTWEGNSCAIDAGLVLAVQLDIWRIRADQSMSHPLMNTAVHVLRCIARVPWGLLSKSQRTDLRNLLVKHVAANSGSQSNPTAFRDVKETYEIMFAGLPQVSTVTCRMTQCCANGKVRYQKLKTSYFWGDPTTEFPPQRHNISSFLCSKFETQPTEDETHSKDHLGNHCGNTTVTTCVVGRLAPILVLFNERKLENLDMTDPGPIELNYKSITTNNKGGDVPGLPIVESKAWYELKAVIYWTGNHYTVESSLNPIGGIQRAHIDIMSNREPFASSHCEKGSWKQKGRTSAEPVIFVFKLCDRDGSGSVNASGSVNIREA